MTDGGLAGCATFVFSCRGAGSGVGEHLSDERNDLGSVQFDRTHDLVVGEANHSVFEVEPGGAEGGQVGGDLLRDRLGRADMPGTIGAGLV